VLHGYFFVGSPGTDGFSFPCYETWKREEAEADWAIFYEPCRACCCRAGQYQEERIMHHMEKKRHEPCTGQYRYQEERIMHLAAYYNTISG
jgi:hypothetical protein